MLSIMQKKKAKNAFLFNWVFKKSNFHHGKEYISFIHRDNDTLKVQVKQLKQGQQKQLTH